QKGRIYKMVSSTGFKCFFVKHEVATSIVNKAEYSPLNKMEKSIDGLMIKENCIKLQVDRLGNVQAFGNNAYSSPLQESAINESKAAYDKTPLTVFDSFEDEGDYVAKQRAETSYEKRLTDVEQLRKRIFPNQLLPDNSWKRVPRIFKIL